jgi:hypothetical protein
MKRVPELVPHKVALAAKVEQRAFLSALASSPASPRATRARLDPASVLRRGQAGELAVGPHFREAVRDLRRYAPDVGAVVPHGDF